MADRAAELRAYQRFRAEGMTKAGACGLIGNLEAESDGFYPTRVEYLCHQRLKENNIKDASGKWYTDATYTAAIDSGRITKAKFLNPIPGKKYGYGLAQWTTPERKTGLYNLAKTRGVSISNETMQLDYLMTELKNTFPTVLSALKTATTVQAASDIVLTKFEAPENASALKASRAARGQTFYDNYAKEATNMAVLIGHASISEHGTINGTAGDQTGKEVCTRSWYSKPWNVMLICTDKNLAARAAQQMRYACANDNIGYGQGDRTTAYTKAKANGNTFLNSGKGNTDCSQLMAACYILAGLTSLSPNCYTGNLRAALLATGKFKAYTDSAHLTTDAYAEIGAVYLKEGSHVVMALENGSKASTTTTPTSTTGGTCEVKLKSFVKGNSDPQIKTIQRLLNALGYKGKDGKVLTVDGEFGANSEYAVAQFQKDKKLQINTAGTIGEKTWTALVNAQ